jgi:hypothetical protein
MCTRNRFFTFANIIPIDFAKILSEKIRNIYLRNFEEFSEIFVTKFCEIYQNKF